MPCDVRGFAMSEEEELKALLQMYTDGVKLVTDEKLKSMIVYNHGINVKEDTMCTAIQKLCYLCKFLDENQLKKVKEKGRYVQPDLWDWYVHHLECDFYHNNDQLEKEIALNELKRIAPLHPISNE